MAHWILLKDVENVVEDVVRRDKDTHWLLCVKVDVTCSLEGSDMMTSRIIIQIVRTRSQLLGAIAGWPG